MPGLKIHLCGYSIFVFLQYIKISKLQSKLEYIVWVAAQFIVVSIFRGQGVIHFRHSEFVHCAKVASMSIGVLLGKIIIWFFNFYSSDAGLREGACENAKHDNFIRSMSPHYWTRIAACLYDHYCDARSFIFLTFASQLRLPTVSGRQ